MKLFVKNQHLNKTESLNNFIKINDWKNENPNIEAKIKSIVSELEMCLTVTFK